MTPPPLRPLSVLAIRHGRGGGAAVPRLGGRIVAVAVVALGAGALAGCTTEPEPAPTPTAAFANEEEAFAAAEAVYRAYNEALNAERAGHPSGDSFDYLTGPVLEQEIQTAQELRDAGVHIKGSTRIVKFQAVTADIDVVVAEVTANVCLDLSGARAIDASGSDVTAVGRSDTYAVEVSLTGDHESLLIAEYAVRAGIEC